jgi:ligand-binding SRPBCC domain-containing protein
MARVEIERSTRLAAPAAEVWRHATSMAGVNAELSPITMSHPPDRTRLPDDVELGRPLFVSTLRLGPVPFDRHELTLVGLDPGRWFQEDSRSRLNRRWRHRRTVTPEGRGCIVTDRLEIDPRLPGAGRATRLLVGWIFDRRHRVLIRRFGRRLPGRD